jgi:hypothetical protein
VRICYRMWGCWQILAGQDRSMWTRYGSCLYRKEQEMLWLAQRMLVVVFTEAEFSTLYLWANWIHFNSWHWTYLETVLVLSSDLSQEAMWSRLFKYSEEHIYIYIHIYIYMRVCVWVSEWVCFPFPTIWYRQLNFSGKDVGHVYNLSIIWGIV